MPTIWKTNLYSDFTKRIIEGAFRLYQNLQVAVSINLDAQDIENWEIVGYLERLLVREPGFAENLIIELLEHHEMRDVEKIKDNLAKLQSSGVRLAIDDFGSGYSNFNNLVTLDIDTIKIDGSLVRRVLENSHYETILTSITMFAQSLGVTVVAEHVESGDIFDKLVGLGITKLQGYCIERPQPAEALQKMGAAGLADYWSRFLGAPK